MSSFISDDRDRPSLLPLSVGEWLPSDDLTRFVVKVFERSKLTRQYAGWGSSVNHLTVPLGLLIYYGCTSGVHSSRKLARVTRDSVTFHPGTGTSHPSHDTWGTFRRRVLRGSWHSWCGCWCAR